MSLFTEQALGVNKTDRSLGKVPGDRPPTLVAGRSKEREREERMQITHVDGPIFGRSRAYEGLGKVVDRIGNETFDPAFMCYMTSLCSAEHFAIYAISDDRCTVIGSGGPNSGHRAKNQSCLYSSKNFWRFDPGLSPVWTSAPDCRPFMARMEIDEIDNEQMREQIYRPHGVRERVVLSARHSAQTVVISLINTFKHGAFKTDDLAALERTADNIVAMTIKHTELRQSAEEERSALTSLPAIQNCLALSAPQLARREAEVCARILYGMTSLGIALDLGIGEESAMTYRKRAYNRLKIGSQRELLLWYLDLWAQRKTKTLMSVQ